MRPWTVRLRQEDGSTIVLAVVSLTAVLAASALAVDVGMLVAARSEAQSAADAAALAGAAAFLDAGGAEAAAARDLALDYATRNSVLGERLTPDAVRVTVDAAAERVRVAIRRPVTQTWFARFLDARGLAVGAEAVAEASSASEMRCVRPFAPANPKVKQQGGGSAGGNGRGRNGFGGGAAGGDEPAGADGSYEYEVGEQIPLWSTGDPWESTFWRMPEDGGWSGTCSAPGIGGAGLGPAIRRNICMCNNTTVEVGTPYRQLTGNHTGSIRHGLDGLLDLDPGATWDATRKQVVGSGYADWRKSPRIVVLPVLAEDAGGNDLRFAGFIRAFVEAGQGNSYYGRYVGEVRILRLVR